MSGSERRIKMIAEPEYRKRIDQWVDEHAQEMLEDLKLLVRIPSVKGEALEGKPYGEMPARAVCAMEELMERYGLQTRNYDNYCVTGDIDGKMEKVLDILAHLDVVPVSDTWTRTKPFEPLVDGDRIYGRGTSDDKGPAIAALYAMRAIRELGIGLRNGVRLICGSDEECGSSDLEYYYGREKEAKYTFSPDADYPLINIEKGRLEGRFSCSGKNSRENSQDEGDSSCGVIVRCIRCGEKANVIPGRGELVLENISEQTLREAIKKTEEKTGVHFTCRKDSESMEKTADAKSMPGSDAGTFPVTAEGRSGHAMNPAEGRNCLTAILELLRNIPLRSARGEELLLTLGTLWPYGEGDGRSLGVKVSDEVSGELTMSLDILHYRCEEKDEAFSLNGCFDCRAPIVCNDDNLTKKIREKLAGEGIVMETEKMTPPHCVDEDSELVQKLLDSYELYFGERGKPLAIGGGTYVHELERGVAFGCAVEGVDNHMHGDDEFMEIPVLIISTKIFADAILRLCGFAFS